MLLALGKATESGSDSIHATCASATEATQAIKQTTALHGTYMRCMEANQPYPYAPIAGGLIQTHALGTGPFPSRDSYGAAGGIHAPVATPSRSDQDNEGALDRGTTTTKIISRGGW